MARWKSHGTMDNGLSDSKIVNIVEEYYLGKLREEIHSVSIPHAERNLDLDSNPYDSSQKWLPKYETTLSTICTLIWWDAVIKEQISSTENCNEDRRHFKLVRLSTAI